MSITFHPLAVWPADLKEKAQKSFDKLGWERAHFDSDLDVMEYVWLSEKARANAVWKRDDWVVSLPHRGVFFEFLGYSVTITDYGNNTYDWYIEELHEDDVHAFMGECETYEEALSEAKKGYQRLAKKLYADAFREEE